jgi:hypothetical protein
MGIQAPDRLDQADSEPRGCVHGNVERHNVGGSHGSFLQSLPRQIKASDFGAAAAQPSSRRSQPKGLVTKFVCRNQDDLHLTFHPSAQLRSLPSWQRAPLSF